MTYQKSRVEAEIVEIEVTKFLNRFFISAFGKSERVVDYFPQYDIFTEKGKTFEIKLDNAVRRTGNFFVELKSFNRSCADYWVFVDDSDYHFIREAKLKNLLGMCHTRKMGGDGKKYEGWLVPESMLKYNAETYPRGWAKEPEWYQEYIINPRREKWKSQ